MSIFSNCKTLEARWVVESVRPLTKDEKEIILSARVISSEFGYSLKFLTTEETVKIPISNKVTPVVGELVDINSIKVITLHKNYNPNEKIYRIEF